MTTEAPRGQGGPPPRFGGGGGGRPGGRPGGPGGRPRGRFVRRRKVCSFCVEHVKHIDYKEIVKIRRENAIDISKADAIAEGFATPDEFFALWRKLHGDNGDCWALDFKLIKSQKRLSAFQPTST